MNIGLIGLANSGKTTIFNAMTRTHAQITEYVNAKSEPNRAMMKVEDSRVTILSDMYMPNFSSTVERGSLAANPHQ